MVKFKNFMGFESTLKLMCWPWGVIYRLWYNYESFPRFVDDPKRVYIAIKDQKKFDEKKSFHRNFLPKFGIFRYLWRSLNQLGLFLGSYYWLKYDHRSFWQSLDDSKYVRIDLMNIKNFLEKSFHRNLTQIWPFPRSQYEKISPLANFERQKNKQ